ncbi:MAG: GNAT family N-acetyltransferase [Bacteroidota bacterium]
MKSDYLFNSERLGFRNWEESDLDEFAALTADPAVMEHFPALLTRKETSDLMTRLQKHYLERGHTYFATEILETGEFIGFIGLVYQRYESPFTPAVDIGWRLKQSAWGKGYATEGAKRCLRLAFDNLKLDKVIATCTERNDKSENVMQKIGMTKIGEFHHPALADYPEHGKCLCYQITEILLLS